MRWSRSPAPPPFGSSGATSKEIAALVRNRALVGLALAGLAVLIAAPAPSADPKAEKPEKFWVFVGTYTGKKSKGIYRAEMDAATGKLSNVEAAAETSNPSFLAIDPKNRFLFAANEVSDFGGKKAGAVSSFTLDPKTGKLAALNQQSSVGAGPCHIVADKEGKHVLVANYGGGSAAVLPYGADGRLGAASGFVQHKGTSVNPARQEAPHAHSINLDPANRYAAVADLGLDKVFVYKFGAAKGTLMPNDPPSVAMEPGAGPRHFAFHPSGLHAYAINEMANTITAMTYNADKGILAKIQTVPTLPKGFKGKSFTADVQVHPSGKYLYGSNRGHNSIVVYQIDPERGTLIYVGHQAEGIKTPRGFGIDPTGTFLIVGNQDGDSLLVFRIDPKSGELKPTGHGAKVPTPVCVKFVPKG